MKSSLTGQPRQFSVGGCDIRDFGTLALDAGDMVTLVSASGRRCDVTATAWGFYLAPSLNGRLREEGFRVALVENAAGKMYLNAVETDKLAAFADYLAAQGSRVLRWLDEEAP